MSQFKSSTSVWRQELKTIVWRTLQFWLLFNEFLQFYLRFVWILDLNIFYCVLFRFWTWSLNILYKNRKILKTILWNLKRKAIKKWRQKFGAKSLFLFIFKIQRCHKTKIFLFQILISQFSNIFWKMIHQNFREFRYSLTLMKV